MILPLLLRLLFFYFFIFVLFHLYLIFFLVFLLPTSAGIMFQDITTLLLDPKAFKNTVDLFVERYKDKGISVVAGTNVLKMLSDHYLLVFCSLSDRVWIFSPFLGIHSCAR